MTEQLQLVYDLRAELGEGPCWDASNNRFIWVDITGKRLHIHQLKDQTHRSYQLDQFIGAAALCETGEVVLALEHGFYFLDLETEQLTPVSNPETDLPKNRFNDGKCDPAGRFWAGTMSHYNEPNQGALYVLDDQLQVTQALTNISTSNGLAWNSDATVLYYIDSPTKQIMAYEYDVQTGKLGAGHIAVHIPEDEGVPDGMTIDEEGMLWVAQWGGWCVSRYNPFTGERLDKIEVPVSQVTSCVFGGDQLDELYITTARIGQSEEQLEQQPHAGSVFKIKTSVKGLPMFVYKRENGQGA